MGIIVNLYKKNFLQRFDKDVAIPYYSPSDFPDLLYHENSFVNSKGIEIHYFTFSKEDPAKDKVVLFCPGIGPGHVGYLTEIAHIAREGYKVVTLDYAGCGYSKGERMPSVNEPTRDVIELLELLKLEEEVALVGHSLGAYTALNVIHLTERIKKAVIISGFIDIASEMVGFVKFRFLANRVKRFEKKLDPQYGDIDNWSYLKTTTDKLLFIHSVDDGVVNFPNNAGKLAEFHNPNIKILTYQGRKHNPNYSPEAIAFMNQSIGGYNYLVKKGELKSDEEKRAYFADKPIGKMTEQDPEVFRRIFRFIEGEEVPSLEAYEPKCEDLWFREAMMSDEKTMSYNHAWGGTIPFPKEEWKPWHEHWLIHPEGKRFYRYLKDLEGDFVGEIAYHLDKESNLYLADVIINAKYRGRGYGGQALEMLCSYAKENGVSILWDNLAIDNPSLSMFLNHGFKEDHRTEEFIFLKREL
ncbi:MAG: alpha/beta fold hydrolase [Bacilli bacterium]|nr:alpha/beta fold hydrolase [Bacilli bacterium]